MLTLARMEFNANPKSAKNQMLKFASAPPLMQDYPAPEEIFCTPYWTSPYGEPDTKATLIDLTK